MEGLVVRMLERDVLQAFEFSNVTVTNDLDLRLVRDGLEIRVQNGAFGVEGLAVAIAGRRWVKEAGDFVLGFWCEGLLVLEEDDLVLVESFLDYFGIGGARVLEIGSTKLSAEVVS